MKLSGEDLILKNQLVEILYQMDVDDRVVNGNQKERIKCLISSSKNKGLIKILARQEVDKRFKKEKRWKVKSYDKCSVGKWLYKNKQ